MIDVGLTALKCKDVGCQKSKVDAATSCVSSAPIAEMQRVSYC